MLRQDCVVHRHPSLAQKRSHSTRVEALSSNKNLSIFVHRTKGAPRRFDLDRQYFRRSDI